MDIFNHCQKQAVVPIIQLYTVSASYQLCFIYSTLYPRSKKLIPDLFLFPPHPSQPTHRRGLTLTLRLVLHPSISHFTNTTFMQATIISQLNYYNGLLIGLPASTVAPYFILVQTAAKMNFLKKSDKCDFLSLLE